MKRRGHKYSGPRSIPFWRRVNSLGSRQRELYALGVVLQNLEEFVLKQLEIAEMEREETSITSSASGVFVKYDKQPRIR